MRQGAERAAWVHAVAAIALALGLTIVSVVASPTLGGFVGYVGGFCTVWLAVAVVAGWRMLIGAAVGGLGLAVGLSLVGGSGELRVDAVAAGVALLAVVELSHRSCESRRAVHAGIEVTGPEVATLVAVATSSLAIGVALLVLAAGRPPGGSATQAAGAAAVVGVLALLVVITYRRV